MTSQSFPTIIWWKYIRILLCMFDQLERATRLGWVLPTQCIQIQISTSVFHKRRFCVCKLAVQEPSLSSWPPSSSLGPRGWATGSTTSIELLSRSSRSCPTAYLPALGDCLPPRFWERLRAPQHHLTGGSHSNPWSSLHCAGAGQGWRAEEHDWQRWSKHVSHQDLHPADVQV